MIRYWSSEKGKFPFTWHFIEKLTLGSTLTDSWVSICIIGEYFFLHKSKYIDTCRYILLQTRSNSALSGSSVEQWGRYSWWWVEMSHTYLLHTLEHVNRASAFIFQATYESLPISLIGRKHSMLTFEALFFLFAQILLTEV